MSSFALSSAEFGHPDRPIDLKPPENHPKQTQNELAQFLLKRSSLLHPTQEFL
jgi:hypothetical protein